MRGYGMMAMLGIMRSIKGGVWSVLYLIIVKINPHPADDFLTFGVFSKKGAGGP